MKPLHPWSASASSHAPDRSHPQHVLHAHAVTYFWILVALAILASLIPARVAAGSDTAQKGSLLVFPNVEVRWALGGPVVQDTIISIFNDSPGNVTLRMYLAQGDEPLDVVPGIERAHTGWNFFHVEYTLTGHQPFYWSVASTAGSGALIPMTVLDPGSPPGRPAMDGSSERVLRGYLYVWAVEPNNQNQIRWDHLSGSATLVRYNHYSTEEYPAIAFPVVADVSHGQTVGAGGVLNLDDIEYAAPPSALLFDFYAVGTGAFDRPGEPVFVNTDLSLLPAWFDARQESTGLVAARVEIDVWNENEVKFTGSGRCITCWDQTLLSLYDFPNYFLLAHLGTSKGRARIDGVANGGCPESEDVPLLGVMSSILEFGPGPTKGTTGSVLAGVGAEPGAVFYDVYDPPPPLNGDQKSDQNGAPEPAATIATNLWSASEAGSVLVFPNIEVRWDVNGNLIQDTFVSLFNDGGDAVSVRLYCVQGDEPLPALWPDRAHRGWNWIDETITLTGNQPTYWAASTGLPAGVPAWSALDPGNPEGRPAIDGTFDRVVRGSLWAWAVDPVTGAEIRWDHLSGGAMVVHYGDHSAWAYDPVAWSVVNPEVGEGELTGTPGTLHFNGAEFGFCPDKLLFDFFAVGSTALDGLSTVDVDGDLTLLAVMPDLRSGLDPPHVTDADLAVWNADEYRLWGMHRCVTGWDQTRLSGYGSPNYFLLAAVTTDEAKVNIDGLASGTCGDSERLPLIGVISRQLDFNNGTAHKASGRTLVGTGDEVGRLIYDPKHYCEALSWTCVEFISRVELGAIDNSSGCDNYMFFDGASAELAIGAPRVLTVTLGNSHALDLGGLWIDWNQDYVFDDAERVALAGSPGVGPYTALIVPPFSATLGTTRMRVKLLLFDDPLEPCGMTDRGEVEDYAVTIVDRTCDDLDGDGQVGFSDLVLILAAWGSVDLLLDLDQSGMVDFGDLLRILASWGPCD